MKAFSISGQLRRITLGLVGVIALAALISVVSTALLRSSILDYKDTVTQTSDAVAILEDVLEARQATLKYRIEGSETHVETLRSNAEEVFVGLDRLAAETDEAVIAGGRIDAMRADMRAYAEGFEAMSAAFRRNDELSTSMLETVQSTRLTVEILMDNAAAARDVQSTREAAHLLQHMLLTRFYAERLKTTGDLAARTRADEELAEGIEHFEAFRAALMSATYGTQAQYAEVEAALETMGRLVSGIAEGVTESDALQAQLDEIGPRMQIETESIIGAIEAQQTRVQDSAARTIMASLIVVIAVAAASVGFGLVVSSRMRSTIAREIDRSLETMTELADGNLAVEIEGVEHETEIGRIARSMVRFRDKAIEARDLAEQQKAQERDRLERERTEEERRKDAEAASARKLEAERRKMISDLGSSIGAVVEAGADGDFARRIEAQFDDPELAKMAEMINRLVANVEAGVTETADVMASLAGGDLTRRMTGRFRGKFADLADSVNDTMENLSGLVEAISDQCRQVAGAADMLVTQSSELARRAEHQAASLEETSAAMEEISVSVKSSAQNSSNAADLAASTARKVGEAGEVVETAIGAMGDISEASAKINEIVSVIDGIAFQTNLLALNAGVEAARAGDAGRGFAVVASEVRALAQRSSEASRDIKGLIEESSTQVGRGVEVVEETGRTLNAIIAEVESVSGIVNELNGTALEQATSVNEVTSAISQLDGMTQQNAAMADESNNALSDLKGKAADMLDALNAFRTAATAGTMRETTQAA